MTYGLLCLGATKNRVLSDPIDRTPVPLLARYKAWIAEQDAMLRLHWSGDQVRRIVVMRRRHDSYSAIGRAIGKTPGAVSAMLGRLPPDLQ